ncbi:Gfo/Idh/MocA family protein [Actinomycetospora termitidis]|uniref:Gfo/Idh/MocA family oxidoreductase n=1 Tax=Actinomycetospora termitidis TaxID=3053470 RepID=A0ABT7MA58_9PSEU|nr:Gfo/Idh/MocA family oxidoreductase [Actinomycetospora sp. Odt1-22]MDL5156313.1 Gfo/Idh/MocA family oxidoreductase [Actinomycetospora sp. Odt1-22]
MSTGWGVVGLGWVARDHALPAIAADPDARLVAVCDRDPDALAAAGPGVTATDDLDAFLAVDGLDAVYVATPNHAHLPVVRAVAAAGVPVLCEKPMAHTVDDACAMVDAVGAGLAGTAFDQRFHPAHTRIRELVAEGRIGAVTAVRIVYGCWLPPGWLPPHTATDGANWRVDTALAGGGAAIDLAPHGIDLVGTLLGEDLATLQALTRRRVHDYVDPAADDGAVLVGATRSGTLVDAHVSFCLPDALPRRRLELVGTRGQLVAENTLGQVAGGTLTFLDAATGAAEAVAFDPDGPFERQLAAFGAAVRGERPWPYPLARDLALHELLLGALDTAGPVLKEMPCP